MPECWQKVLMPTLLEHGCHSTQSRYDITQYFYRGAPQGCGYVEVLLIHGLPPIGHYPFVAVRYDPGSIEQAYCFAEFDTLASADQASIRFMSCGEERHLLRELRKLPGWKKTVFQHKDDPPWFYQPLEEEKKARPPRERS